MSDCGCEKAKAGIYDLLRGELCAEESAPIREHLERCPDCHEERQVCETLTAVVQRACEQERPPCPGELRDAILRELSKA